MKKIPVSQLGPRHISKTLEVFGRHSARTPRQLSRCESRVEVRSKDYSVRTTLNLDYLIIFLEHGPTKELVDITFAKLLSQRIITPRHNHHSLQGTLSR